MYILCKWHYFVGLLIQIDTLKLDAAARLTGKYNDEEMEQLRSSEPLPKKDRTRLQRVYVPYVVELYTNRFGNQHVLPDIILHVADAMTSQFPSLRDPGPATAKPTFVSDQLMKWCMRHILKYGMPSFLQYNWSLSFRIYSMWELYSMLHTVLSCSLMQCWEKIYLLIWIYSWWGFQRFRLMILILV